MKKKPTKMLLKKRYFLLVFLLVSSTTFSQTKFYQGLLNQTAWDNLITEINTKTKTLKSKIAEAETANLESSYARGSIVSVREFVVYATKDREKAASLQTIYETSNAFRGFNRNFESQLVLEGISGAPDYSLFHPYQQLYDCINILDFAIAEIQDQLDGNIILSKTLDFTAPGKPRLAKDASYYTKGRNVIFPSTFWSMPDEADLMETNGYLGETFNSPQNTERPGVTRSSYARARARSLSKQIANNQTPTQVHYTHTKLPAYMRTDYPGIGDHPRAFVHYDIDHPEITNLNRSMISTFNPGIVAAAAGSPLIYVLSNEPHWNIAKGEPQASLGVSNHTMNAYVEHLKAEYKNINRLNRVYNSFNGNKNFTNFNQLKTEYTIPLDRKVWQGTPIWYDWLRFNMNRSNRWHKNLKTITRESHAAAKISIKILGREVEDPRRDGGIDVETLMDMQDVIGFDAQVVPNETHGRNNRKYSEWLNRYIMDWREQTIMLDFAKSLHPNKPTFDSEWHAISSNAWDNFRLDRGYVRSSLWLAFSNGMSVLNCWWWYREHEDRTTRNGPVFKGDLEGKALGDGNIMFSPQHQAVSFDTFGRTMKEINAHSNTVASLIPAERDVLIYYSNEAAIQDYEYAGQMSDVYEALKLLNVKVGFTTPSKINSLGYKPKSIIIPPTLYSLDSTIDSLATYKANNPSVDMLQVRRIGNGVENFGKDEKGTPDASRDISFINKSIFFDANINSLINRLRAKLVLPTPPVNITLPGTTKKAFGVFASKGNTASGKEVISLINVSLNDREIKLPDSSNYINLLDGKVINSTHVMKPYDVLLLEKVRVGSLLGIDDSKVIEKTYSIYPIPAKNSLNIVNDITGKYTIYNVNGAIIKSVSSKEKSFQINVDNLSSGVYFLELPTNEGKQVETIIISN
ncbi:hypothetical protein A8C32_12235 [Flavivirga aquatica]|uniref:Secretion system C-terminal sorting domain-containing protein n=1 Tax=Flavivirga aquatica TaxID=1849968 RepID=A0A1E5TDR1_9FLAO|nr:T9SS type A sorting domain-containing protein [Flavivirga aquatica]OEK09477.1 hypothetical protein A8C32_12235 [Flavivirga aquatica]